MADEITSVPGDRDAVSTDGQIDRSKGTVSKKVMPVLFGAGIVGGFVIAVILVVSAHSLIWPASDKPETKQGTARTVSQQQDAVTEANAIRALNGGAAPAVPGQTVMGPNGQPISPAQQALLNGQPVNTYGNPQMTGQGQPQVGTSAAPRLSRAQQLALASQRAPIMGFAGGMGGGFSGAQSGLRAPQGQLAGGGQAMGGFTTAGPLQGGQGGPQASSFVTSGSANDLSGKLNTGRVEVARASIIGDRNFLIAAGRTIPCSLTTAINSTQAGIVNCIIGQDVYSENGRVVMLDKGTKILGEYTGGIRQGQARLFVVWKRALTPRGVIIDLGSPASDELGRAGIGGGVDTMFWQRFGAALMFSVLEDAASVASTHFAGYGTNSTQVPAQTASAALQGSQNVQPILKANQGQTVAIQVARDYDFGQVYDVRIRTAGGR